MAFNKTVPQWNAPGTEPPSSLKQSGFTAGYKPPAAYFNWFWYSVGQCLTELQNKHTSLEQIVAQLQAGGDDDDGDYLPLTGGTLSGALTVMENFNVNKTYDNTEYKTFVRPINYSIGNNGDYSTGLIHYKGNTSQAQLMFNKDGVMLRDNVAGKAYQLFGQHNPPTAANVAAGTFPGQVVANATAVATTGTKQVRNIYAGTSDMTAGTTTLATGDIYLVYE